jgi:integrase
MASKVLISKLDEFWLKLRLKDIEVPGEHLLLSYSNKTNADSYPTIEEAMDIYLKTKGRNRNKNFFEQTERAIRYLVKSIGLKPINIYTSADAAAFRDHLMGRGLKMTSVHRHISTARAILTFVINEHGLNCNNPFKHIYMPAKDDSIKRMSVKGDKLRIVQKACLEIDDDIRHLMLLVSDSGMRLGEAVGLLKSDLHLDDPIPYVTIQPHPHRSLKTLHSKRDVPLIGCSLWAAKRIKSSLSSSHHCFPRYSNDTECKPNAASAMFAYWLKAKFGKGYTVHGFRHGLRDRLRNVGVPSDAIDQIGGWSKRSIGETYGDGYSVESLHNYMKLIEEDVEVIIKHQ